MLRIGLVVGETSGDQLGAGLIESLRAVHGEVVVEGILGPRTMAAGGHAVFPMERLSVMGLVEVISHYPELASIRNRLKHHFFSQPPDVFIGIDSPDFNLDLERDLKEFGIKTIHYVSPSVWAWRRGRVKTIAGAVDKLLTLFPFEADFYRGLDVNVECVGHPLADSVALQPDTAAARRHLDLPTDKRIVALMPGSRHGEFSRHLQPFLQTARQCWQSDPGLVFVGNLIDSDKQADFDRAAREVAPDMPVFSYVNESQRVLEACDVALLASGTITLEAMLYKKPMVIAYRLSGFSYHVLKALITSPWVGLPNILAQQRLVPEFFQNQVTPQFLAPALMHWLQEPEAVAELQHRFTEMHRAMKLNTNDRAARAVLALCRQ